MVYRNVKQEKTSALFNEMLNVDCLYMYILFNSSGLGFNWAVGKMYSIIVSILFIYLY